MKILITGGSGFVGSNLAIAFKSRHPAFQVIAFDNLRRRGSELNLPRLQQARVDFIHGDLRNPEDLLPIGPLDVIIDAAAEPSVSAGISESPDYLVHTNFTGTYHLLEFARRFNAIFIFLSTSRVYSVPNLNRIHLIHAPTRFQISPAQDLPGVSPLGISESFPMDGFRTLYGASKLASELFVQEYHSLFRLPTVINRCGILAGPHQMGKLDQGVVTLWMARHFYRGRLSYFGHGGKGVQVRDILHSDDLYRLLAHQIFNIDEFSGNCFNVGGGAENAISLLELTDACQQITGNRIPIDPQPETQRLDIPLYISDFRKLTALSGWKPTYSVQQTLLDIYNWIRGDENRLKSYLA